MNYRKLNSAAEAALKGVTVEFDQEDRNIKAVRLTDADGKTIVVKQPTTYSDTLAVFEPELFTYEDRVLVKADLPADIKVRQMFTDLYEAKDRVREINSKFFCGADEATYSNIKAQIDATGKIVGYVDVSNKPLPEDDLPF